MIGVLLALGSGLAFSPPVHANSPCPPGKPGYPLTRSPLGDCIDATPPSPSQVAVIAAKNDAASTYAAYKSGSATQQQLDAALNRLAAVTGETPVRTGKPGGVSPDGYVGVSSEAQVNSYYCGPATAEDILWYLGPTTSNAYDTVTSAYDSFNYTDSHDQGLLANYFWLATDDHVGTNWGPIFMPFTLNGWHGGGWYEDADSGGLTSSGAWYDADFDTSYGHPVAENVFYAGTTYYPAGFTPRTEGYLHWDVLYQTVNVSGALFAGIAEPWPCPTCGGTRTPYQTQSWSSIWSAVSAGHGLVW